MVLGVSFNVDSRKTLEAAGFLDPAVVQAEFFKICHGLFKFFQVKASIKGGWWLAR
jgi:hypothetical protein